jgi:hypothetical protein
MTNNQYLTTNPNIFMLDFFLKNQLVAVIGIIMSGIFSFLASKLYKRDFFLKEKHTAFKKIKASIVHLKRELDINSTPFVQIYDFFDEGKTIQEWQVYFNENISPLYKEAYDFQSQLAELKQYIPKNIHDLAYNYSEQCIRYISTTANYNTITIFEMEDIMIDAYNKISDAIDKDTKRLLSF